MSRPGPPVPRPVPPATVYRPLGGGHERRLDVPAPSYRPMPPPLIDGYCEERNWPRSHVCPRCYGTSTLFLGDGTCCCTECNSRWKQGWSLRVRYVCEVHGLDCPSPVGALSFERSAERAGALSLADLRGALSLR